MADAYGKFKAYTNECGLDDVEPTPEILATLASADTQASATRDLQASIVDGLEKIEALLQGVFVGDDDDEYEEDWTNNDE